MKGRALAIEKPTQLHRMVLPAITLAELQNRCITAEAQPANKTIATARSGTGKTHWPAAHGSAQRVIIAALTGRHGCIMVDWSRPFDDPIQLPKGKKLVTLKDAAAYILALPKSKQQSPEWQAAGEAVIMAAEDRGPLMHAHVAMMLALHGAKPIPEYDSSKEKHWGRRKLKRDE
jgi:hypothetical protein